MKIIQSLWLATMCLVSFSKMHAKQETMLQYLLRSYEEICQRDDDQDKIENLKILLEEVETYYEGLPLTPDATRHICWLMCWSIIAYNNCCNKGFIFYLSCFAATYKAVQFFDDMSRYGQRDKIRERYARLESFMAGIKARLDQNKKQSQMDA